MACPNNSSDVVVCSILCFLQNKMHCAPLNTLGDVMKKGFDAGETKRAKLLIFDAASKEKELSHVRKITRKNTGTKKKTEADENIIRLLMEADAYKVSLLRFATIDINRFPHIPI